MAKGSSMCFLISDGGLGHGNQYNLSEFIVAHELRGQPYLLSNNITPSRELPAIDLVILFLMVLLLPFESFLFS